MINHSLIIFIFFYGIWFNNLKIIYWFEEQEKLKNSLISEIDFGFKN